MSKKRYKAHAEKRQGGSYVAAPHVVLRSPEYAGLSPRSTKLLWDLLAQYKGDNNGDLCAAMTVMRERGWRSKEGLQAALQELTDTRFVVVTRRGGRHKAALYGVTFFAIDYCNGKLDIEAPTRRFMGDWRRLESATPPTGQSRKDCPTGGAKPPPSGANYPAGRPSRTDFREPIAPPAGTFLEVPLGTGESHERGGRNGGAVPPAVPLSESAPESLRAAGARTGHETDQPAPASPPAPRAGASKPEAEQPAPDRSEQARATAPADLIQQGEAKARVLQQAEAHAGQAAAEARARPTDEALSKPELVERWVRLLAADGSSTENSASKTIRAVIAHQGISFAAEVLIQCERREIRGQAAREHLNERRAVLKARIAEEHRQDRALALKMAKQLATGGGRRVADDELESWARTIRNMREDDGRTREEISLVFERSVREERLRAKAANPVLLRHHWAALSESTART
jgi:hypothetical protein